MEIEADSDLGSQGWEFRDPSYYVLYILTVMAWIGAAVALVLWAPWT